jgi:hypothetical protein
MCTFVYVVYVIHCKFQRLPMKKALTPPKGKSTKKTKAELKAEEEERRNALRTRRELEIFGQERNHRPGALSANETWWCQQYLWLKSQGYLLRRRYAPDWVPSWEGTQRNPFDCEDGHCVHVRDVEAFHPLSADRRIVWPNHGRNPYIRRLICFAQIIEEVATPA